jgi:hypothetical protein
VSSVVGRTRPKTEPAPELEPVYDLYARTELRTLALALLASLLLWNLPFGGVLLYPFKLLATWLHELSHGITMILTGAGFDEVLIYRDTSGLAYAHYRIDDSGSAVIAAAGYMGTPLWGALLLVVTPTARAARWAMLVLAALMTLSAILFVGNDFGVWAVSGMAAAFAVAAIALPPRWRVATAHFVAAQACVNALLDIRVLFRPMQVVNGEIADNSDAHNMAKATFDTAETWAVWTWAVVWLVWSLVVLFVALKVVGTSRWRFGVATAPTRAGS